MSYVNYVIKIVGDKMKVSTSWTTLQEQILAKLRRPYRSEANMNEVGHASTYPSFIKKFIQPVSKLALTNRL
jgi:hypothetical protein